MDNWQPTQAQIQAARAMLCDLNRLADEASVMKSKGLHPKFAKARLDATDYLLSNPVNEERLAQSVKDADDGKLFEVEL